jgi:hypothetical protein
LGVSLEYLRSELSDYGFTESVVTHSLVTALHAGYRLPIQRIFLHPSTSLNFTQRVAHNSNEDGQQFGYPSGDDVEGPPPLPDRPLFVGDVRVEIGFYF